MSSIKKCINSRFEKIDSPFKEMNSKFDSLLSEVKSQNAKFYRMLSLKEIIGWKEWIVQ